MVFYAQVNILSLILKVVSSEVVEEIAVPGENQQPLATELTNLLI